MELLELIMKWIVAPVAAFVWVLHGRVERHDTEIEVIKAMTESSRRCARTLNVSLKSWTL